MRPLIRTICVLTFALCAMHGIAAAQKKPEHGGPTVVEPNIMPADLGFFGRSGAPFQPTPVRPEIKQLDDERLLRLLNRSRREMHKRLLRARLRANFSPKVAKELERSYELAPALDIDGMLVGNNPDLEMVYHEAMSEALARSLVTDSCELEAIYDDPPGEQDPILPHVDEAEGEILTAAKSVVAIMDQTMLTPEGDGYRLDDMSFKTMDDFHLCDFAALYGLPMTNIYGTGFLVQDDLIVTAAHVANRTNFIENARFVFDYTMPEPGEAKTFFTSEQVYQASEEVVTLFDEDGRDLAVIRLKEIPPPDTYPSLTMRAEGLIANHEKVYVVGHPLGLPQMYTGPKELYENAPCVYFMSTLDTYDYHSGSPVINAETHMVEGVVTSGGKEIRSYCGCDAPTASTTEHGFTTSFANRVKMVSDALALPGKIVVVNETTESVIVQTDVEYGISTSSTDTIAYSPEMLLVQLPQFGDREAARPLYRCMIRYLPQEGETWKIMKSEAAGTLYMARCSDEPLIGVH